MLVTEYPSTSVVHGIVVIGAESCVHVILLGVEFVAHSMTTWSSFSATLLVGVTVSSPVAPTMNEIEIVQMIPAKYYRPYTKSGK